jgi:hypothetical protein
MWNPPIALSAFPTALSALKLRWVPTIFSGIVAAKRAG